jgi:hypothetical protein
MCLKCYILREVHVKKEILTNEIYVENFQSETQGLSYVIRPLCKETRLCKDRFLSTVA